MDEVNEQLHPDYQKRFNDGYLIAKHVPDLAEKLRKIKSNSVLVKGLVQGIEQYDLEKNKQPEKNKGAEKFITNMDYQPKWKLDELNSPDKDITPEKDLDKDELKKE